MHQFICPHCSSKVSAIPAQLGKKMPCPQCDRRIPLSAPVESESESVSCPACHEPLAAPLSWAGKKVHCPECDHHFTTPGRARPRPPESVSWLFSGALFTIIGIVLSVVGYNMNQQQQINRFF